MDTKYGELTLLEYAGSDLGIVNAARVSYGKSSDGMTDGDKNLLKFLKTSGHTSTFEHTFFSFKVKCPLFIRSQWMRHRIGWSFNEQSGRYTVPKYEFYVPDDQQNFYTGIMESAILNYKELLKKGMPKEVARGVLPQGMFTNFVASCNLRSLLHFISLRIDKHAQKEIRVFAEEMMTILGTLPEYAEISKLIKENK